MTQTVKQNSSFGIHALFAVLAVFFFYSNIPGYLYLVEMSPFPPLFFFVLTLLGLIFLTPMGQTFSNNGKIRSFISNPLKYWIFFYLLLTCIWFIPSQQSDVVFDVFIGKIRSVLFMALILFILSDDEVIQRWARRALVACVILAVFNNIFEMLNPFSFVPMGYEFSNPGRSAGLYVNANRAGAAIVLGAIFGIGVLPDRFKTAFVILCTIGIIATFSRSSLLGWFVVCLIFSRQRLLSLRSLAQSFLLVALLAVFSFTFIVNYMEDQSGVNVSNVLERTEWFSSPMEVEDESASERKLVARRAWEMFMENPILGSGIASTISWDEAVSTHNMYLFFMADHGFIGAFILPFLVAVSVWKAEGEARRIAVPFVFFVLFFGFFSHNIVEEYYFLMTYALMSALSSQSRSYEKQHG